MEKGAILFHSKFRFTNGEEGEKLLIVLNNPNPAEEPYLVCRVTSQRGRKPKTPGCHEEHSLFFLPGREDFFEKDTWIQLHEIFSFNASELLRDHFDGRLNVRGNLKDLTIRQLMNCIRKIKDISRENKEMILRR